MFMSSKIWKKWRSKMRTILITGASGGLAQEIVKLLPEDRLILLGRNQEKLEKLYANHPQTECIGIDITDPSAVQQLVEELYQRYRDRGLVILGFPCGQFLGQELSTGEDAASFCSLNYGVSFPMMKKVRVNGRYEDPIFTYLKRAAPGTLTSCIKWNFTKFLISRDGSRVLRFSPMTKPEKLAPLIEQLLAEQPIDLED